MADAAAVLADAVAVLVASPPGLRVIQAVRLQAVRVLQTTATIRLVPVTGRAQSSVGRLTWIAAT